MNGRNTGHNMILTITLNPLLEKRMTFLKTEQGKVNRCYKEYFTAGGKGINVSRQLNVFKVDNLAVTAAGGNSGKIYRKILAEENINNFVFPTEKDMRQAFLAEDDFNRKVTSYFGVDVGLTEKEFNELNSRIEKMILNASTVVLAGSVPDELSAELMRRILDLAHKHDKFTILDTYGTHLLSCLKKAPGAIHNNIEELSSSLGRTFENENDIKEFLKELYSMGIKLCFLTDGARPSYSSQFGFMYKTITPEIEAVDSTGSGDSFTAGVIYALEKSFVFEDLLKFASASGAANSLNTTAGKADMQTIEELMPKVKVIPLGKKLKEIDDSPTI